LTPFHGGRHASAVRPNFVSERAWFFEKSKEIKAMRRRAQNRAAIYLYCDEPE
jgi:hypothetical protein